MRLEQHLNEIAEFDHNYDLVNDSSTIYFINSERKYLYLPLTA